MGLDMYLYARKSFWDHNPKEKKISSEIKKLVDFTNDSNNMFLTLEVMYWRKANQIHQWFVDNVQDGNDDCGEYYVSRDDIEKLISACNTAWIKRDSNILPTKSGFFFGSTEVDDWYWDEIQSTSKRLQSILDDPAISTWSLYYRSSW
jgi:hypothetical protein